MADRRRRTLPAAAAALILLLGLWIYQGGPREEQGPPPAPQIARDRVSYYLRDLTLTVTRDDGSVDYRVDAERMRRFDETKTWTFRAPRWTLFTADGPPWHGTADFGRAWDDGDQARLSGNVHMWRPKGASSRPLDVVTSEVYLKPRQDYARTDRPLVATSPGMRLRGIGAELFMKQQRLKLLSHVEGDYDAMAD